MGLEQTFQDLIFDALRARGFAAVKSEPREIEGGPENKGDQNPAKPFGVEIPKGFLASRVQDECAA